MRALDRAGRGGEAQRPDPAYPDGPAQSITQMAEEPAPASFAAFPRPKPAKPVPTREVRSEARAPSRERARHDFTPSPGDEARPSQPITPRANAAMSAQAAEKARRRGFRSVRLWVGGASRVRNACTSGNRAGAITSTL